LRIVRVDLSISAVSLNRDVGWVVAAAVFAAVVLPVLVYYTGTATLGPYAHGGLQQFFGDFYADLARLRGNAWVLLLGPVLIVAVWRILVAALWPRHGR
jgi:hypothetical protein